MQLSQIDIAKLSLVTVATIAVTLLWVHRSTQEKVSRTGVASIKIGLRLIILHAIAAYLLCGIFSVPSNAYLVITSLVFLIASAVSLDSHPGSGDAVGFAIGMMFIMPHYVLKQYVLGFPDRDLVIPAPDVVPRDNSPPACETDIGIVVSTLRPMGIVELAGRRFNAASATGTMIEVGTNIRISGQRGNVYLVTELETDGTQTA